KKVQAYNFRICLTNDPANRIGITRPDDYDPARYELLLRVVERMPGVHLNKILKLDKMPDYKTDINNNGGFSTDMIGMNYNYPEADEATRRKIRKAHEDYAKGLLYFIGHDQRMPLYLREEMLQFGYPADEYADNGNWSPQLYIREARRMVGEYVMTQANCQGRSIVEDGICRAAYGMDSHNCQRVVVNGMAKNEGDVQVGGFPPYPVSYRSILPRQKECANLLAPVCLSASHIAYGSIRMEPVFMVLSQAAATAAVMSIDRHVPLHKLDVHALNKTIADDPLANGSDPDIIVDNTDKTKISLTGEWQPVKNEGYGPDCLVAPPGQERTITFRPHIAAPGNYSVYLYVLPSRKQTASRMEVEVFTGRQSKQLIISKDSVQMQGQTSGEWYLVGKYDLKKGGDIRVTVSNRHADGEVIGDAVLFHRNN
ncbi:MAG TPA: FAD-dependent oxidoreductase, partial [Puia sp.]|nr:FAD-dependent oxidoreductase [Puia sp.]